MFFFKYQQNDSIPKSIKLDKEKNLKFEDFFE